MYEDGFVQVFGDDEDDQCNIPWLLLVGHRVISAACGGHHTAFIRDDFDVVLFGNDIEGQCDLNSCTQMIDNYRFTAVACGAYHTCLLNDEGGVIVFGYNG